jgi:hypothetical protein
LSLELNNIFFVWIIFGFNDSWFNDSKNLNCGIVESLNFRITLDLSILVYIFPPCQRTWFNFWLTIVDWILKVNNQYSISNNQCSNLRAQRYCFFLFCKLFLKNFLKKFWV